MPVKLKLKIDTLRNNAVNLFISEQALIEIERVQNRLQNNDLKSYLNRFLIALIKQYPNMQGLNSLQSIEYVAELNVYKVVMQIQTQVGEYRTANVLLQPDFQTAGDQEKELLNAVVKKVEEVTITAGEGEFKALEILDKNTFECPKAVFESIARGNFLAEKESNTSFRGINAQVDKIIRQNKAKRDYLVDGIIQQEGVVQEAIDTQHSADNTRSQVVKIILTGAAFDQDLREAESKTDRYKRILQAEDNSALKDLSSQIDTCSGHLRQELQNLDNLKIDVKRNFVAVTAPLSQKYNQFLDVIYPFQKIKDLIFGVILKAAQEYYLKKNDVDKFNKRFGNFVSIKDDNFIINFAYQDDDFESFENRIGKFFATLTQHGGFRQKPLAAVKEAISEVVSQAKLALEVNDKGIKFTMDTHLEEANVLALAFEVGSEKWSKISQEKDIALNQALKLNIEKCKELFARKRALSKHIKDQVALQKDKENHLKVFKKHFEQMQANYVEIETIKNNYRVVLNAQNDLLALTDQQDWSVASEDGLRQIITQAKYNLEKAEINITKLNAILLNLDNKAKFLEQDFNSLNASAQVFAKNPEMMRVLEEQVKLKAQCLAECNSLRENNLAQMAIFNAQINAVSQKIMLVQQKLEDLLKAVVVVPRVSADNKEDLKVIIEANKVQEQPAAQPKTSFEENVLDHERGLLLVRDPSVQQNVVYNYIPVETLNAIHEQLSKILTAKYNAYWHSQVWRGGDVVEYRGAAIKDYDATVPNGIAKMIGFLIQYEKSSQKDMDKYHFVEACLKVAADKYGSIQNYERRHGKISSYNHHGFFAKVLNRELRKKDDIRSFYQNSADLFETLFTSQISAQSLEMLLNARDYQQEVAGKMKVWQDHLTNNIVNKVEKPGLLPAFAASLLTPFVMLMEYINPFLTVIDSLI